MVLNGKANKENEAKENMIEKKDNRLKKATCF
jgi:hypothetical protein